jgi:threonyl-tRNA synthetase
MLVVGDQEVEAGQVAPRLRSGEKLEAMPVDDFIARARREIEEHS